MEETRRVLFLVENAPVPGDPRVWNEAVSLHRAGYQVSIIAPQVTTRVQEPVCLLEGIPIYRFTLPHLGRGRGSYLLEYSLAFVQMFWLSLKVWRRHGFDVLHIANPPDSLFLIALFYRCFAKKFVFDQHDLAPELFRALFQNRGKWLYDLLRLLEYCSYHFAHLVIVPNESFLEIATRRGGCVPEKLLVVRNGPVEGDFACEDVAVSLLREKKKHTLLYIGVMGKQDGVENALYALYYLIYVCGRSDVLAIFIGDGSAWEELQALTSRLGLRAYVHFAGWLEQHELARYLREADIGLVPDAQNGFNEFCTMLKVMEYMAAGMPCVAFDLKETRVSACAAALYASPNSIPEFALQIERLLNCEELRHAMGAFGQKRARDLLCWERSVQHLLEGYERLFGNTKGGARGKDG